MSLLHPSESQTFVPKRHSSPLMSVLSLSSQQRTHTCNESKQPSRTFMSLLLSNTHKPHAYIRTKNVFQPDYIPSAPDESQIAVPKQNKRPYMSILSLSSLAEERKKRIYATHKNYIPGIPCLFSPSHRYNDSSLVPKEHENKT